VSCEKRSNCCSPSVSTSPTHLTCLWWYSIHFVLGAVNTHNFGLLMGGRGHWNNNTRPEQKILWIKCYVRVKHVCKPKETKSNSHNNRQVSQKVHFGFELLLALMTLCVLVHIEYYRTSSHHVPSALRFQSISICRKFTTGQARHEYLHSAHNIYTASVIPGLVQQIRLSLTYRLLQRQVRNLTSSRFDRH
jgi:hypothetical protein